jgi:hypothetical protein
MSTDFWPVPDSAVGNPISVTECYGLTLQAILNEMPDEGFSYDEEFEKARGLAWGATYDALVLGDLHSFAYDSTSGRWVRVPWQYWLPFQNLTWPLSNLFPIEELQRFLPNAVAAPVPDSLKNAAIAVSQETATKHAQSTASALYPSTGTKLPKPVSPVPKVPEKRLIEWFKTTRLPAFENLRPPTWHECWDAAKAAHAPLSVTKEALLEARRIAAPEWSKPGPRAE